MKRHLIKAAAAGALSTLLLCLSLTPALAAWPDECYDRQENNLIANPGFEDGCNYWEPEGAYSLAPGREGGECISLSGENPKTVLRQIIQIPSPGTYELKGYFSQEAADASALYLETGDGTSMFCVSPIDGWRRAGFSLTIETAGEAILSIIPADNSSPLLVDDLALVPRESLPGCPEPDPEENLLEDPGFEDNVDGWVGFFNDTKISRDSIAHTGNSSMCLYGATSGGYTAAAKPMELVLPAGEYEMSAWVYLPDQGLSQTDVSALAFGEKPFGLTVPIKDDDNWHKITWFLDFPETTIQFLIFTASQLDIVMFVDDLSLTPAHCDPVEPEKENLLENPGFESALSGWTAQGGGILTTDAQAFGGTSSAMFSYFSVEGLKTYLTQSVSAGAGAYTLSAMVRPDTSLSGVGAMLLVEARDKTGALLASKASPAASSPAGQWQALSVSLTAPGGTAEIVVKIGGVYCTGAFYVDDVSLKLRGS